MGDRWRPAPIRPPRAFHFSIFEMTAKGLIAFLAPANTIQPSFLPRKSTSETCSFPQSILLSQVWNVPQPCSAFLFNIFSSFSCRADLVDCCAWRVQIFSPPRRTHPHRLQCKGPPKPIPPPHAVGVSNPSVFQKKFAAQVLGGGLVRVIWAFCGGRALIEFF